MKGDNLWEYTLQPEDEGKRYQEILFRRFHFSRKLIQKLKLGEHVWINGEFKYLNTIGKAGDRIAIELNLTEEATIPGEEMDIEILYEDDYLLALNKPPGIVVHPTPLYPSGTLGNAVIGYWQRIGESRPFRPVSRLDRDTSGVVIIAKNRFTHHQLAWQHVKGHIKKRYLGWVQGVVNEPLKSARLINAPIGVESGSFIKRTIRADGQEARTRFQVLRKFAKATLLEFILETGRTHQIRVHSQYLGHPLLGDDLYDGSRELIGRQALHALSYSLLHPHTGNPLTITAPLPSDLRNLARQLRCQGDYVEF